MIQQSWQLVSISKKLVRTLVLALLMAVGTALPAGAFNVDTTGTSTSGLWWAAPAGSESGWGATITQEYGIIFVAIYTYDQSGAAVWYVGPDCAITGGGCTSLLYRVTGGSPLTSQWNGAGLIVTQVGSLTLAFSDVNNGTMSFSINGLTNTKSITRQVFANPPAVTDARAATLQMVGSWATYSADHQTLFAQYVIPSSTPTQGQNGWFIKGSNLHPYAGFPSILDGTAVQAGYNTTISKYYIIDLSAENGFVWEFQFDTFASEVTGCRYRYPTGAADKGTCLPFWATHT